ncbi:HD domain-containing protein [Lachnospiraceae bacterium XBB1006]|nr:HD domain-containing protein [Lachnospiraceae bacterium XBB1006]
MGILFPQMNRERRIRAAIVFVGIAINVTLYSVVTNLGWSLYLDTVGTIMSSALAGIFPGIVTAVLTNLLCSIQNPDSFYYALVNVAMAIMTAWFVRNRKYEIKYNYLLLILSLGFVSAVMGGIFMWLLGDNGEGLNLNALEINFISHMLDKSISCILVYFIVRIIPKDTRQEIWNARWRQKPLSDDEIKAVHDFAIANGGSLRARFGIMLTVAALSLGLIMSWISMRTYRENQMDVSKEQVQKFANMASKHVRSYLVGKYLKDGGAADSYTGDRYQETVTLFEDMVDVYEALKRIELCKMEEDGYRVILSTDLTFQKEGMIGDKYSYDDTIKLKKEDLLAGKEMEVVTCQREDGYYNVAFEPIVDENGQCLAYVCVDLAADEENGFVGRYALNTMLAFSGFFILILGYGQTISGHYLIYPIGSMAKCAQKFVEGVKDQEQMDEAVRNLRKLDIRTDDELEQLYKAICEMAAGTSEQMRSIRYLANATAQMQNGLIITMADLVENRDSDTGFHVQKTAAYVKIIAEGLKRKGYYAEKMTPKFITDVVTSAPLHDIGKINIPDAILNKPGKLSEEEFEVMKGHTTAGRIIMESAIDTVNGQNYLKEARNMAAYHHEWWNGSGYPEGLHGQVIPLSARIMAVADVFDALTSPRVYKPAFSVEKSLEIIREGSGKQFDPKCVEVFLEAIPEVMRILKKYREM